MKIICADFFTAIRRSDLLLATFRIFGVFLGNLLFQRIRGRLGIHQIIDDTANPFIGTVTQGIESAVTAFIRRNLEIV